MGDWNLNLVEDRGDWCLPTERMAVKAILIKYLKKCNDIVTENKITKLYFVFYCKCSIITTK